MKKTTKTITFALLVIICIFSLVSCSNSSSETSLWENAMYLNDTELGEGSKTLTVAVTAEGKTVNFTIKTDKKTVGAALLEHNLIEGEESEYGLYIKVVNGITADYDIDKSYWSFYVGGEYATSGVDTTEITESTVYKLVHTR